MSYQFAKETAGACSGLNAAFGLRFADLRKPTEALQHAVGLEVGRVEIDMDWMEIKDSYSGIATQQPLDMPARAGSNHLEVIFPKIRNSQHADTVIPIVIDWLEIRRVREEQRNINGNARFFHDLFKQVRSLYQTVSAHRSCIRHKR